MNSKCRRPESRSSRQSKRSNWDAARCSVGSRFGLHVMSSRNAMVWARSVASCSKSWKCLDTQCRSTFSTRIVAGELTIDSLRFLASTSSGGSSRGLLDPEMAIANAAAAVDVLLLEYQIEPYFWLSPIIMVRGWCLQVVFGTVATFIVQYSCAWLYIFD